MLHVAVAYVLRPACVSNALLSAVTAGVVDVEVVMSKEQPGSGRGFCFVEFYNHSAAAHAKTMLGSDNFQ